MERSADKEVVIHTFPVGEFNDKYFLTDCLFVTTHKEWDEIGKYLTKESFIYSEGYPGYKIELWELYHTALILEADFKTLEFIDDHGNKTPLKYLQQGVRMARNKDRLEEIFNQLAMYRRFEVEDHEELVVDPVTTDKNGYYGAENFWLVDQWLLPVGENDVERCRNENQKGLEKALAENTELFQHILQAKKFYCTVGYNGLMFRISFEENTEPWNPKVIIELEFGGNKGPKMRRQLYKPQPDWNKLNQATAALNKKDQAEKMVLDNFVQMIKDQQTSFKGEIRSNQWQNPERYGKTKCSLKHFLYEFLPSLTKENYKAELENIFV
jgi:hypothetical protein